MSRSPFRHQFMMFDMAADSHSTLPLTSDEALDDRSEDSHPLDSRSYRLRARRSGKSLRPPVAPPPTRKSSLEFFDYNSHDKARGGSFSSDVSAPSMVEDHSGLSDSDGDPSPEHKSYEESMSRIWDTYQTFLTQNEPSEAIIFHPAYLPNCADDLQSSLPPFPSEALLPKKISRSQPRLESRYSRESQALQRSFIPISTRSQHQKKAALRHCREAQKGQLSGVPGPLYGNQAIGRRRSLAKRAAHNSPNILKSLPATPQERTEHSPQSSPPRRSGSQRTVRPFPNRQHAAYQEQPYHARRVTNPCNSSHPYSIHNTPALPLLEKSVFEYDTDDESHHDPVTQLSTAIASRMHIRGLSLGSKLGLNSKTEEGKSQGTKRRRSATEIVRGVFGLGRR